MQNKVPLPTDNIYKFCALFGLIILIFSLGATIYITKEANVQIVDTAIQLDNANSKNLSDETKNIIEGYRKVIVEDRKGLNNLLIIPVIIGIILSLFGFNKWIFKIQPQLDKLTTLQTKKSELENEKLELEKKKLKLEITLLERK